MTDRSTATAQLGRRERKKLATRKAISDAATMLFLERGFDQVSIREIAEVADVSPTTVFAHFPQKEALVFDEDEDQRELLIKVVTDRAPGTPISRALHDYFASEVTATIAEHDDEATRAFMKLVNANPALREYAQRMWLRHEDALAEVIAAELGQDAPEPEVRAYARFVIQIQVLVYESTEPMQLLEAAFALLEPGWAGYESERAAGPVPG